MCSTYTTVRTYLLSWCWGAVTEHDARQGDLKSSSQKINNILSTVYKQYNIKTVTDSQMGWGMLGTNYKYLPWLVTDIVKIHYAYWKIGVNFPNVLMVISGKKIFHHHEELVCLQTLFHCLPTGTRKTMENLKSG